MRAKIFGASPARYNQSFSEIRSVPRRGDSQVRKQQRQREHCIPMVERLETRRLLKGPPTTELTEGNAAEWSTFASDNAAVSVANDMSHVKVGTQSLKFTTASGFDSGVAYTVPG